MRTNISIQSTSEYSSTERHGEARRESDDEKRKDGASKPGEEDGFPAQAVGQTTPEHTGEGFGEGEGGDENAGVEGGVIDPKALDHEPGIREDGSDGDRLGKATYCWRDASVSSFGLRDFLQTYQG